MFIVYVYGLLPPTQDVVVVPAKLGYKHGQFMRQSHNAKHSN